MKSYQFCKVLFIIFILVFNLSILCLEEAYAAAPVIFYSDLISGPNSGGQDNKGVFVTISGKNFGSSQGSSYVSVGGGQADNYPVWTDTKIAFQLGTNAVTGDIKVITSEGTSNGVPFTVRSGNIYFVDITNGNDSNVGSYNNPWKTLLKFKGQTQVGDICYAREGNYEENINFGVSDPDGDENNEICWIAYPDEVVTIIENQLGWSNITFGTQRNYYVISGFKLLSQANCIVIRGNYNRIINNDCEGLKTQAYSIINPSECNYAKIYGNKLHGARSGNKLDHPLYIGYGADNVDFGWNHIYDNDVSYGPLISINQDNAINTGVQFKGILIHDNIIDGTPPSGANRVRGLGLIAQDIGSDVKVYNNIFIECGGDIINSSYTVYQISGALELYNNTFYNSNGLYAVIITCDPLSGYYAETVNVKNNVFYVTGNSEYVSVSTNGSMGSVVLESNCYYGNDNGPIEDLSPINEDPLFLDKDNNNFRLQYGSPCIDAGYNTSAIVTTDKDGLTRPQNSVVDIGAFEYTIGAPSNLLVSILSESTILNYIELTWEDNSMNEDGFKIERKLCEEEDYTQIAVVLANTISYTDTTAGSANYDYRVRSFNNTSNSDYSNVATILQEEDTTGLEPVAGSGSGGGGCFIATASFGTPLDKNIKILCDSRDRFLSTNEQGRIFVKIYEKNSPLIADHIRDKEFLKALIRLMLRPLVVFCDAVTR